MISMDEAVTVARQHFIQLFGYSPLVFIFKSRINGLTVVPCISNVHNTMPSVSPRIDSL